MLIRFTSIIVLGVLATIGSPLQATDLKAGKTLVDKHCYQCHGTEYYTRNDRKVQSLDRLHDQVKRCELALELKWFDEEIGNVAGYLNTEFYKFQ